MGGLVLGLCLKKYAPDSIHFDLYESAAELTEFGAGVGMSLRVWSIMRELGLEEDLLTITGTRDRTGASSDPVRSVRLKLLRFRLVYNHLVFPALWFRKGDEGKTIDLQSYNQGGSFCAITFHGATST